MQDLESPTNVKVAVLMGTFNGEKYISEQIKSIINQSFPNWTLFISDDGSSDSTIQIIESIQTSLPPNKIKLFKGPSKGFSHNFLSLATNPTIKADFYFFSDQDDIWLHNKIETSINNAIFSEKKVPSLYCGRTFLGAVNGKIYGQSIAPIFPCNFRNALVQCVAGGNTMVFNQALKDILEAIEAPQVVSHDWWLYQLTTAIGGNFHYDNTPTIIYRQHPESLVGENTSIQNKLDRIKMVLNGRFKNWNGINIVALENASPFLTKESLETLNIFKKLRSAHSIRDRFRLMNVSGIFRQSRISTFALLIALLLGKI